MRKILELLGEIKLNYYHVFPKQVILHYGRN